MIGDFPFNNQNANRYNKKASKSNNKNSSLKLININTKFFV